MPSRWSETGGIGAMMRYMLSDVEKLLAIEKIKNLKARYFRAMDTKDWDAFATVFAPDAVFDFREAVIDPVDTEDTGQGPDPVVGADAIVDAIRKALSTVNSVHHGHMPEIEITSETTAIATWPMEDVIRRLDTELRPPSAKSGFKGYGYYHETYVRIDDSWRIKTSKLTRLRVTFE